MTAMLILMKELAPFFLYIFVMSVTPGPNTILSMINASEVGLRKGIRLNFGMLTGVFINMTLSFAFSKTLEVYIPKAEPILRIMTSVYLFYLAFKCIKSERIMESSSNASSFLQGLLLQLVNAKVYLLCLTAITMYILPYGESLIEEYSLSLLIPFMCFSTGLLWAIFGSALRTLFSKYKRAMNLVFAFSLLFCAIKIFF